MNGSRGAVVVLIAWLGGLAWVGRDLPGAWAQEKPEESGDKERKELEKQASALAQQGLAHYQQGRLEQAIRAMEQCLSLQRRLYPKATFPDGRRDLATSLTALGVLWEACGQPTHAERFHREALAMNRQLYPQGRFPDGHPHLARSLNNLGHLLQDQGEYSQAETYSRQALEMRQRLYPPARYPGGHPDLATSLNNLGALLMAQGEYGKADPCLRQALEMRQRFFPPARYPDGHPLVAQSLNNLGQLLKAQEYGKAEPYLRQALEMRQRLYPPARYKDGHPDLARSLNNLGRLLQEQGEYGKAEPYLRQALEMTRKLYPPARYPDGHPQLATSLGNLGSLLQDQGEYGKAETYFRQALEMAKKLYPPARYKDGHPQLATSLNHLGSLLQAQAKYAQARPYFRQALDIHQRWLSSFAAAASEAQALNFLARLPESRDAFLSCTANLPDGSPGEAYALLWQGRAALARVLEQRQRLFHTLTDDASRRQLQELLDVRRQLAQRVLRPDRAEDQRPQRLQELTERRERLERALAAQLPQLTEAPPSHPDLLERLPPETAFVDFFRFLHRPQGEKGWRPHYAAFVLRQGAQVARVALGEAEPIEQALAAWRKDIASGLDSKAAAVLRERLWDKLAPHLPAQPGSTVYLCPDGDLSGLPWAALPGRAKGTILLEDHALALVPHGQALLEQLRPRPKDRPPAVVLALGGPRFDQAPDPARRPDDLAAVRPAQRSNRDGVWPELPGSGREASAIAALARSLPRPLKVLERSGSAASATQLYLDLPKVRWAHLATHGFFAAPETKERKYLFDEKEFRLGVQGLSGKERRGAGARHPLTQTGLVLAGANRQGKEAPPDGGILTAEAIAGLNLENLDLAVLSACETGLGEAATGEGVFGLQRAFHLGGCRNVVASLWKVDDDATAALMNLFYYELWRKGQPPLQALRRAQLALYRHPGEVRTLATVRGPDFDKTVRRVTQPPRAGERPPRAALVRDWAAFVLSGSGR